ncbi:MAG TPA: ABC transporter permease [Candidatus Saccharimonadales bacterium]|nr:ABC transporter permease [Candidatus Saccharimonadales bacterium]
MHPRIVLATSARVFKQLRHDPRTLALMLVVPCVLLGLLAWMYSDTPLLFDHIGASLLGIFPFVIMFLITSITTLRERTSGTLERLLAMPVGKLDIILGYALTFGFLAMIQSLVAGFISIHVYGLNVVGPEWFVFVIAIVDAILGAALGLFVSAFASTEFQAVQFMPAFILPQFLLCGLLVPLAHLPHALYLIAKCLPLTYSVSAMQWVSIQPAISDEAYRDVLIVLAFAVGAIILGAATLRRQTK